MSLSDVEIALVTGELAGRLLGTSVGKIFDAPNFTLTIELGRDRLLVSAHPRASRLHLTSKDRSGSPPSGFPMLLRKHLGGLRLQSLHVVVPDERVVELGFGPGRDRLVAELMGAHANVFLLDAAGLILASFRPPSLVVRALDVGSPWTPPAPAHADARWRGRKRFGESPGVADRIAAHYEAELRRTEETDLRSRAGGLLRKDVDRLTRRETALAGDLAKIAEAAVFRKYGDLLLAHMNELPGRGAVSVTVPDDFEDGSPLTIALDQAMDGRQNAARYYKQHKRLTGGRRRVEDRLAATRAARITAETRLATLPNLSLDDLRALVPAPKTKPPRRTARPEPVTRLPYREFRSAAGHLILVGRTAADNDTLTFRHARSGDLWLHTRDAPGSHVIVRAPNGREIPEQTLLDAATLAAHHSPLAGEAQVDITYTPVKNVRKPKGTAPGLVFVSDAKTLRVRLEPARLDRLLGRDPEPD